MKKGGVIVNIIKLKSWSLKVFSALLFVTAITGVRAMDRYVPVWLYSLLAISSLALVSIYGYDYYLRKH